MSWWEPKWRSTSRATSTSAASASPSRQRDVPALGGDVGADACRARRVGHVLDGLVAEPFAHDLTRDLADQIVVGRHLAADDGRPRPQLALIATMLGSPLTGLQVNITPETLASTISCTATPIAGVAGAPSRSR